jgi:hypothetical protein
LPPEQRQTALTGGLPPARIGFDFDLGRAQLFPVEI